MTVDVELTDITGRRGRARPVPLRSRVDFWLDLSLLIAFTLDYSFNFTGLSVHEWVGLGFGIALVVHVVLHWDWVLRTTGRLFGSLAGRERLRYLVDTLLLLAMTLCVGSGLLISRSALPALGIHLSADGFWTGLHSTTADVCVALVSLHVALSWRWILSVGRRILRRRSTKAVTP
jgi:hypothetical protein